MNESESLWDMVVSQLVEASDREVDRSRVTVESSLRDDFGIDSLQAVTMVLRLEEAFDIEVADEELEQLRTVGDLIRLIEGKKGTASA